ncbi:MAG: putative glycoside hydrolase [Acidobacteriota bacterium]
MRFRRLSSILLCTLLVTLAATAEDKPPVAIHAVDAVTNAAIPDATVTLGSNVLPPQTTGDYSIPATAQQVMLRAPGYKAVTFSAAQITSLKGKLALTPFEVRSLYITEYGINSAALRDPILRIIRAGGANSLTINIKTDYGLLDYPSQIPLAQQIGARKMTTIHSLTDLVNAGHAQGIYMIARIVTFKDTPLATAHPEYAIHLANGELFYDHSHLAWVDPWRKEVRAYDIAVAVEAAKAGFDEVQFDYVRFPDSTSKLIVSGPTDEAGRVKAITSFLADAHKALIPYNVFQSADIFGYDSWNNNDTGIGQHLEDIVPAVDYVCPMLYPSGFRYGIPGHPKPMDTLDDIYSIIRESLDKSVERTHANPKKFRPWLQAFRDYAFQHRIYGPEEIAIQVKASKDAKSSGWSLWNARNVYSGIGLAGGPAAVAKPKATKPAGGKADAAKPADSKSASPKPADNQPEAKKPSEPKPAPPAAKPS